MATRTKLGISRRPRNVRPISVHIATRTRFTPDQAAWIAELARARGCSKVDAIRELVTLGHAHSGTHGLQFSDALQQLHVRLSEVSDALDQIAGTVAEMQDTLTEVNAVLSELNNAFGKVWVETLMANRLLLDAHNRGLIERVRDMTTRYLERMGQ